MFSLRFLLAFSVFCLFAQRSLAELLATGMNLSSSSSQLIDSPTNACRTLCLGLLR
eukprot:m.23770 g.23770  ORF g.23770 m.23770 type:complete len:56 (-) comp35454_c0_seq1:24-191(-)